MKTGIDRAIEKAGGQTALAAALGVSQAAVWAWQNRGWVPLERAVVIEAEYGIPARDLVSPRIVQLLDCWSSTCDLV